jgi:hypothetical protein
VEERVLSGTPQVVSNALTVPTRPAKKQHSAPITAEYPDNGSPDQFRTHNPETVGIRRGRAPSAGRSDRRRDVSGRLGDQPVRRYRAGWLIGGNWVGLCPGRVGRAAVTNRSARKFEMVADPPRGRRFEGGGVECALFGRRLRRHEQSRGASPLAHISSYPSPTSFSNVLHQRRRFPGGCVTWASGLRPWPTASGCHTCAMQAVQYFPTENVVGQG